MFFVMIRDAVHSNKMSNQAYDDRLMRKEHADVDAKREYDENNEF